MSTNNCETCPKISGLKIVNGLPATPSEKAEFNYFCSIALKNSTVPFCGGVYLKDNYVLTAAHCVYRVKNEPSTIKIQFNKKNLTDNGLVFNVTKINIHPKFILTSSIFDSEILTKVNFDFAILTLDNNPSNFGIKNNLTLGKEEFYKKGIPYTILGYGATSQGQSSKVLQIASIHFIPVNESKYTKKDIKAGMFLAGRVNSSGKIIDTCQGDSGGPLFCKIDKKIFLLGLTSWGIGCGLPDYPGVYAKVSVAKPWILSIISKT